MQAFGGILLQPKTIARRVLGALIGSTVAVTSVALAVGPAQADDATQTSVAGTITLDGTPTGGLTVCAGGMVYVNQAYEDHTACTTTAADGRYAVSLDFPGSSSMAAVWVDPGTKYQGVFPWTAVNQVRDLGGYITLTEGDHLTGMDIALASYPKRFSVAQPVIVGTAKVGKKLSATVSITGADTAKVSYRWYRNGHKIAGATKKTYRVTKRDRNKRITVTATVRAPGHAAVSLTSAATKKIARH